MLTKLQQPPSWESKASAVGGCVFLYLVPGGVRNLDLGGAGQEEVTNCCTLAEYSFPSLLKFFLTFIFWCEHAHACVLLCKCTRGVSAHCVEAPG